MKKVLIAIFLFLTLFINSCGPVVVPSTLIPSPTNTIKPSSTPFPTLTSTRFPTSTSTSIPFPTITPTPSVTPTPHPLSISVQNASALKLVSVMGAGKVNDVAWAKQKAIIGVAQDSAIYLYNSETFDVLGKMNFGASRITFSPDGSSVAVVNDSNIVIWNIDEKRIIHQFNSRIAGIRQVIFSPGGTYLAALGVAYLGGGDPDHVIEAWEVISEKKLLIQQGFGWEGEIAFSPDGRTLALGSPFGVTLFNVLTGKILQTNTDIEIGSFVYLKNGNFFGAVGPNRLAEIDSKTLQVVKSIPTSVRDAFRLSPDEKSIVVPAFWDDKKNKWVAQVWDVDSGEIRYSLDDSGSIHQLDFGPDGKYFVSVDSAGYVIVRDLFSGEAKKQLEFTTEATDVAVIPSYESVGFSVLAGYWGGQVRLFDLSNGQMVKKFESHGSNIDKVSFAPNNGYVLAAGYDFSANIWSLVTGELVKTLECPGASARNLLFTKDETWAALECDGTIEIWDSELRASDLSTDGHFLTKLPPANRLIALTPLNEQGDFWVKSVPEGETLFNFSLSKENAYIQISDVAFSPDGALFALGAGNGTAYIWNVNEKDPKYSLAGHEWTCFEGGCSGVNDVAFDPYGKLLASAGFDKTVRLWDVNLGKQVAVLKGFADSVNSVTFSSDGRYLIAGCHDGKVYVWSIK